MTFASYPRGHARVGSLSTPVPEGWTTVNDDKTTPAPDETAPEETAPEEQVAEATAADEAPQAQVAPAEPVVPDTDDDPDIAYGSIGEAFTAITDGPDGVDETAPPQYGVGPFSIREVALGGVWLVALVVSFFPVYGDIGSGPSVWSAGIDWILTIGVPTAAVFLLALRRLSPQGIRRVGSLGIDQFASVAFSVSTVVWLGILWNAFIAIGGSRVFIATWVVWASFILMLAGVLLTVFAPLFPTIGDDFRHRTEVPAHRFARPARPVVARPVAPRPAPAPAASATDAAPAVAVSTEPEPVAVPVDAEPDVEVSASADTTAFAASDVVVDQVAAPAGGQPFWALSPVERTVVDDSGAPAFVVGPTAWALVIEDRGDVFVIRHEDGRIGYLTDVSDVTRG